MSIKSILNQSQKVPAKVLLRKAMAKFNQKLTQGRQRRRDMRRGSNQRRRPEWIYGKYGSYVKTDFMISEEALGALFDAADEYCSHKFDLLGSGSTHIHPEMQCGGIEGVIFRNEYKYESLEKWARDNLVDANLDYSLKNIELIGGDYIPIDWQRDFRSGFRWYAKRWSKDIRYGDVRGADIKMPWELGRMQHLPQMAIAAIIYSRNGENSKAELIINEFRNQIIDFISFNPPRFGVQWMTAMDVGIRAVSMLIAYDFFICGGFDFPDAFRNLFKTSVFDHAEFIIHNPEWGEGMRGNHFLANIAALAIISSYLPENKTTRHWNTYAHSSLIRELFHQFNRDGTNFEASTYYHLFANEMLAMALLISGLKPFDIVPPPGKMPALKRKDARSDNEIYERINRIFEFSGTLLESRRPPQIGDNDSGRFIRLLPEDYFDFACTLQISNKSEGKAESVRIYDIIQDGEAFSGIISGNASINENISFFPDFGLYLLYWKNRRMAVRCGRIGQNGKGGHAHNDQLSITLDIDGVPFVVDPGAYVYTSFHDLRNKYRSTMMHNTLIIPGREQNEWDSGGKDDLFWLKSDRSRCKVIEKSENYFIGEQYGYGKAHRRRVEKKGNIIYITDICEIPGIKRIVLHFHHGAEITRINEEQAIVRRDDSQMVIRIESGEIAKDKYYYSPSYGKKIPAEKLMIVSDESEINWSMEIVGVED
jgi:hypothetical protein